jgi:chromosome segregation ATPase
MPATKAAPTLSPERARLAETNAAVVEWEGWLERLSTEGQLKATRAFGNADRRVDAAKLGLRQAEASASRSAVSRLLDATDTTTDPLAQARAELAEAEAALSNASAASRALDAELAQARSKLDVARAYRGTALAAVLKADPQIAALLAEWYSTRAHAASLEAALRVVSAGLPHGWDWERSFPVDQAKMLVFKTWAAALEIDPAAELGADDNPPLAA